jgi:hypothetical protein
MRFALQIYDLGKMVMILVVLIFIYSFGCTQEHPNVTEIKQKKIEKDLVTFTNEMFQGRDAGSEGNKMAADFISKRLDSLGLQPLPQIPGDAASNQYFQEFEIVGINPGEIYSSFSITIDDSVLFLQKDKDYHYYFNSRRKLSGSSEIIFAGYAIDAPEYNYNDFHGLNIENKIVLAFYGEPLQNDSLIFFNGSHQTQFMMEDWKARAVAERGGVALILMPTPDNYKYYSRMLNRKSKPKASKNFVLKEDLSVPLIYLSADFTQEWSGPWIEKHFTTENERIRSLVSGKSVEKLQWTAPNWEKSMAKIELTYSEPENRICNNILAFQPGYGESDEFILVGAHYDHEGMKDGEIFPGADDNASGAMANLHVATAYAQLDSEYYSERNVIFAFWDAEEKGTLGTRFFVDHPPVPLENIKTVFNMDMIGRDASFNFAALRQPIVEKNAENQVMLFYSAQSPQLKDFAIHVNQTLNLDLKFDPNVYFTSGSDHRSFHARQIPVVWYFTGFHTDYTSPDDTADKINYEKLTRITRHIANFSYELANTENIPVFNKSILYAPEGDFTR